MSNHPTQSDIDQGFQVLEADHHRNGVGGEGFYVGIVATAEEQRFLVTVFPATVTEGDSEGETDFDARWERVSVLDLDMAERGNIYMFPQPGRDDTGGNAWRGADQYADHARAVVRAVERRWLERDTQMLSQRIANAKSSN